MSETSWKTPGTIIGLIVALTGVVALYLQYTPNKTTEKPVDTSVCRGKKIELQNRIEKLDKIINECERVIAVDEERVAYHEQIIRDLEYERDHGDGQGDPSGVIQSHHDAIEAYKQEKSKQEEMKKDNKNARNKTQDKLDDLDC